jgi:Kef-type K+ transport system membrane component KefB
MKQDQVRFPRVSVRQLLVVLALYGILLTLTLPLTRNGTSPELGLILLGILSFPLVFLPRDSTNRWIVSLTGLMSSFLFNTDAVQPFNSFQADHHH